MSNSLLRTRLKPIRRRWWFLGTVAGTTWSVIAGILLLLFGGWIDLVWELSPEGRLGFLVASILLGVSLLLFALVRIARNSRTASLARRVDRTMGFGGAVLTGCELDQRTPTASALSISLARMAVEHAAELAGTAIPGKTVPARPVRYSALAALSTVALLGFLFLLMPDLMHTQRMRFFNPYGDVPRFSNTTIEIEDPEKQVVYGDPLDIRAVVRGEPVDSAELVLEDASGNIETVPLFPEISQNRAETYWRASLARVTENATYHVRAYRSRSTRHSIEVILVPRIENVRFRVEPPSYANRPAYEGPLPKDGISGLPGARVTVRATSNRPLSRGEVLVTTQPSSTVPVRMVPALPGDSEVSGEFIVTGNGRFELRLFDEHDRESRDSFAGGITLLKDERPMVRIVRPPARSLATSGVALPILIYAEDDYGISQVRFFRSLNDSRFLPMSLPLPDTPPRRFDGRIELPLPNYGLKPGDTIKLFARVEDNDPTGPKGAESPVVLVEIISQEEFERMVRARDGMQLMLSRYREALRRLEALAAETRELQKELEQMNPEDAASSETKRKLEQLAARMQKEADAIRELAEHPLPYDLDRQLSDELEKAAKMAEKAAESVKNLAGEKGTDNKSAADRLGEIGDMLGVGKKSLDASTSPHLELLAVILPLKRDENRFVRLVRRQKDLAERLSTLKGRDREDDPTLKVRMRELEDEQRELREELDRLLNDIQDHALELPEQEEFENLRQEALEFVEAVRASRAEAAMSEAQAALAEYSGTVGHARAAEAAEILEQFLSQCQGMGKCASNLLGFRPGFGESMNRTMRQLLRDMGFGGGFGTGASGAGDGFGAERGGGNVGLYGSLPGMTSLEDARGGTGGGGGNGKGGSGTGMDFETESYEAGAEGTVSGTAEGTVPLRYRQAVGRYFQRILEESIP